MKKQLNGNFLFYFKLFLISFAKALKIDSNYLHAWNSVGIALDSLE